MGARRSRELDARASRLATRLVRLGAGPDARVGVCFDRSLELVVSLLAVLKAGAAWVPLDSAHPAERLGWMLAEAFEMARMLAAVGEEVELLALVDSRAPGDAPTAGLRDDTGLAAAFLLHLGAPRSGSDEPPASSPPWPEESGCGRPGRWRGTSDVVCSDLELGSFERLWKVFRANVDAASAYRPGPCASDPLPILAEHRRTAVAAETARWEALTTGTARSATVPASHFTLIQEPLVRELASLPACGRERMVRGNAPHQVGPSRGWKWPWWACAWPSPSSGCSTSTRRAPTCW